MEINQLAASRPISWRPSTICPGSLLSLRRSCLVLIRGLLLLGQELCRDSEGISLSKGPFRLGSGLAMDFLKGVLCPALPWCALPTSSMFGFVRPIWLSSQSLMLTTGPSCWSLLLPWPKLVTRLTALLICFKSPWMPRSASLGLLTAKVVPASALVASGSSMPHVTLGPMLSTHVSSPTALFLTEFMDLQSSGQNLGGASISFKQKVLLIARVAWPRALHAVSAAVVGKKRFEALRTAVMQALGQQKPGANPDVQCCLEGHAFDPQAYAILETIRDARSLGSHGLVTLDLQMGPLSAELPTYNSLSEILCQRLHQAGFQVLPCGQIQDALGKFSFLDCGFGELVVRFQHSWTSVVASKLVHRSTFAGFSRVDVAATRLDYQSFDGFDQGALRKFLHGALITNDHAQHWSDAGASACLQCGCVDSVYHRLWECSGSAALRAQLPEEFHQLLPTLPAVVSQHGWTMQSSLWEPWLRYLADLPIDFPVPSTPPPGSILDLFTDGSCLYPDNPWCRVAAFSVIHASPFCLDFDAHCFRPLINLCQVSSNRLIVLSSKPLSQHSPSWPSLECGLVSGATVLVLSVPFRNTFAMDFLLSWIPSTRISCGKCNALPTKLEWRKLRSSKCRLTRRPVTTLLSSIAGWSRGTLQLMLQLGQPTKPVVQRFGSYGKLTPVRSPNAIGPPSSSVVTLSQSAVCGLRRSLVGHPSPPVFSIRRLLAMSQNWNGRLLRTSPCMGPRFVGISIVSWPSLYGSGFTVSVVLTAHWGGSRFFTFSFRSSGLLAPSPSRSEMDVGWSNEARLHGFWIMPSFQSGQSGSDWWSNSFSEMPGCVLWLVRLVLILSGFVVIVGPLVSNLEMTFSKGLKTFLKFSWGCP